MVTATVQVMRGATSIGVYYGTVGCSTTSCAVTVHTGEKRDSGRFARWCGSATQTVTVTAGNYSSSSPYCYGASNWRLSYHATIDHTHAEDVSVTITVNP